MLAHLSRSTNTAADVLSGTQFDVTENPVIKIRADNETIVTIIIAQSLLSLKEKTFSISSEPATPAELRKRKGDIQKK